MDVIMPQLGETVAEGVVTRWYKKVGDAVKADDVLFDVETDKVSTEIPAQANGVIAEILVQEGVTAKVGERLAVIREAGAPAAPSASSPVASTASADGAGAQRMSPTAQHAAEIVKPPASVSALGPAAAGQSQPLSAVRKRVAENMAKSWTTVPHVLQVVEADFYRIEQARRELGPAWNEREGFTLTYLPFVLRAVSIA